MTSQSPVSFLHKASGWSIAWGVLLIGFGILAVGLAATRGRRSQRADRMADRFGGSRPSDAGVSPARRGQSHLIWKVLVGLAYIVFGGYLLMHPLLGVASLTLLLASLFLIEAVFDIVLYAKLRPAQGSSWILFDGLVTLVLSILIWAHWPSSSAWAIGTLVGVSMIMSGVARVMMSLAVRHVTSPASLPKAA